MNQVTSTLAWDWWSFLALTQRLVNLSQLLHEIDGHLTLTQRLIKSTLALDWWSFLTLSQRLVKISSPNHSLLQFFECIFRMKFVNPPKTSRKRQVSWKPSNPNLFRQKSTTLSPLFVYIATCLHFSLGKKHRYWATEKDMSPTCCTKESFWNMLHKGGIHKWMYQEALWKLWWMLLQKYVNSHHFGVGLVVMQHLSEVQTPTPTVLSISFHLPLAD